MRALIQRVEKAGVCVDGYEIASIAKGLLLLIGIEESDTETDAFYLAAKIARLRIFDDENGVMNLSVSDIRGELLAVSQFTLHALTAKGNRPSYIKAARPDKAEPLYEFFCRQLQQESGIIVHKGKFGAHMHVSLVNDGPVTILIDSQNKNA